MHKELAELRRRTLHTAEHVDPQRAALVRYAAHFLELAERAEAGEQVRLQEHLAELDPKVLAQIVQERRLEAKLSLRQVASRAGLALNTVRAVEAGATKPAPKTLSCLLSVPQLGLAAALPTRDPGLRANCWLLPQYNRRALFDEMREVVHAPGGRLEQTWLYLDDESAADWLAIASAPATLERFRALPFEAIAAHVIREIGAEPLEVVALGPGDGRTEIELCATLLRAQRDLDLHLYLLDISHSLVTLAHERAREVLPASVRVEALHGDFRHIARYPVLRRHSGSERRRCYMLLGGTLANVDNEVHFIRDGLSQAVPGDLALVDFQLTWADARDPEAVRAADPIFRAPPAGMLARWFCGPLRRYASNVGHLQAGVDLVIDCPVRGSYEVDFYADATRGGDTHRFHLVRVRRYEPGQLLAAFERLGWQCVTWMAYGTDGKAAVALLRRG